MIKILTLSFLLIASPAWAIKIATGTYTGNGTSQTIDISDTSNPTIADFQPEACIIKGNNTSAVGVVWSLAAMGSNAALQFNNTNAAFLTGVITAFTSNGFSVGSAGQSNANTIQYYYICFAPDGINNDFDQGSYVGDDSDPLAVTMSPNFQPEFCQIQRVNETPVWKTAAHSGEATSHWWTTDAGSNVIQAFTATGVEVGTNTRVNDLGVTYYYMCFAEVSGVTQTGTYTGNGTSQSPTVGFAPDAVLVSGSVADDGVLRNRDLTGSNSCSTTQTVGCTQTTAITALGSNDFSVGSSGEVNTSSSTYYWIAVKASAGASASTRRVAPIFFQ